MSKNLYWTSYGVDNYIHNYIAVEGMDVISDLNDYYELFAYQNNNEWIIVLKNFGISIIKSDTFDNAVKKLNDTISDMGINSLISVISSNTKNSPKVPDVSPTVLGELFEMEIYKSIKTGEENSRHTKWYKDNN